jgi:cytochrome c-type biogenesis protein CcmH/NrfG
LKAKRKPDAARAYRRALDLDPDNRQLQSKISKVK